MLRPVCVGSIVAHAGTLWLALLRAQKRPNSDERGQQGVSERKQIHGELPKKFEKCRKCRRQDPNISLRTASRTKFRCGTTCQ
jgi:hypothetical protein